jgi:hypothetical protein
MTVRLAFFVLIIISGTVIVQAQNNFSVKTMSGSIKGTSTLHDWQSEITKIDFRGDFDEEGNTLKAIRNVEVKIRVESIKSTHGKKMDNKTYESLKSKSNPFITYTLSTARVEEGLNRSVSITATGNLSMAGKIKVVSISAVGKVLGNGDLQVSFSKQLKMTEFEMKPPVMFLGTIKVGDEITVQFDLILTRSK